MIQRLLSVDTAYQIGEVRQANGLRSMCLGERCYGGGSGTLWATPGETVDFTVVGGRTKGYLTAIYQAIFPGVVIGAAFSKIAGPAVSDPIMPTPSGNAPHYGDYACQESALK